MASWSLSTKMESLVISDLGGVGEHGIVVSIFIAVVGAALLTLVLG